MYYSLNVYNNGLAFHPIIPAILITCVYHTLVKIYYYTILLETIAPPANRIKLTTSAARFVQYRKLFGKHNFTQLF